MAEKFRFELRSLALGIPLKMVRHSGLPSCIAIAAMQVFVSVCEVRIRYCKQSKMQANDAGNAFREWIEMRSRDCLKEGLPMRAGSSGEVHYIFVKKATK